MRTRAVLVLAVLLGLGGCGGGGSDAAADPPSCGSMVGKVLTKSQRDAYCIQDERQAGWQGIGDAYSLVAIDDGSYLGLRFCKGGPVEPNASDEMAC